MVGSGATKKEIMNKFGNKTYPQVDKAYLDALVKEGTVPAIRSGRGTAGKKAVSKQVKLNQRGSLIIPIALIDDLGITEKDTFEVRKTKAGISLKRIESNQK